MSRTHQQISKKEKAINGIHAYLTGFVEGILGPLKQKLAKNAYEQLRKVAEDIYIIVKKAEGYYQEEQDGKTDQEGSRSESIANQNGGHG